MDFTDDQDTRDDQAQEKRRSQQGVFSDEADLSRLKSRKRESEANLKRQDLARKRQEIEYRKAEAADEELGKIIGEKEKELREKKKKMDQL